MSIFEANHGLADPLARAEKVLEAQRILQRGPSASTEAGRVGLAIGFVQSGKTMSFTTLAALAADSGYRVVIVILGNTHLLVGQNRDRLADDLGIDQRDDWRWAHLHMPKSSMDIDHSATDVIAAPGATSGRGPNWSKSRPTKGASRPMTRPPGSSTRPVSSVLRPSTDCR